MNQIFHHWSRVATDSTSWDYPVCTHDTLLRQHYVRTSKEYLINCHILLQYFELVFLQLQLVQILCKLIIIWVNYEKGFFFMKHCVVANCSLLLYPPIEKCLYKCSEFSQFWQSGGAENWSHWAHPRVLTISSYLVRTSTYNLFAAVLWNSWLYMCTFVLF